MTAALRMLSHTAGVTWPLVERAAGAAVDTLACHHPESCGLARAVDAQQAKALASTADAACAVAPAALASKLSSGLPATGLRLIQQLLSLLLLPPPANAEPEVSHRANHHRRAAAAAGRMSMLIRAASLALRLAPASDAASLLYVCLADAQQQHRQRGRAVLHGSM